MSKRATFLARLPRAQRGWIAEQLRMETVGGGLLLAAAAIALVWANSPWGDAYASLVSWTVGPSALHLDLSLGTWAADGLLAVFFFVVGLELKHELVLGSLSKPARAAVPIAAAIGGMVLPAAIYAAVNMREPGGVPSGWGVPMATDIAFALAVLAIAGRRLPMELRAFLLTLAVVDDLGAITVIAVFYTDAIALGWLAVSVALLAAYALLQRRRVTSPAVYVPLALAAWAAMHASGVHATVAGVALGLLTRVRTDPGEAASPADRLNERLHPLSAGICVPVFAFMSAGVDLRGIGIGAALATPVALGVMAGLVIGKPLGILGTAWVATRLTRARHVAGLHWLDVAAVGVLGGIGFTVALLIAELGFTSGSLAMDSAKASILAASAVSALLAIAILRLRRRHYSGAHLHEGDEPAGPHRD